MANEDTLMETGGQEGPGPTDMISRTPGPTQPATGKRKSRGDNSEMGGNNSSVRVEEDVGHGSGGRPLVKKPRQDVPAGAATDPSSSSSRRREKLTSPSDWHLKNSEVPKNAKGTKARID